MNLIVSESLPFNYVDKEVVRSTSSLKPISSKKLKEAILIVTKKVESIISQMLPDRFAFIFDGWSAGDTHFVAIIASFIHNKERRTCLLAFSPLRDETSQDASTHVLFLEDTLKLYGKTLSNVCCLIGDNCSTNKAVANLCKIPLVGCHSHILNLAVKNIFLEDEFAKTVLPKVVELMRVLSTPKGAAQLRNCFVDCTGLKAIKKNETRWTSTYDMLERYIKLLPHLSQIEEASIVKNF
jgi:hypothetical protein